MVAGTTSLAIELLVPIAEAKSLNIGLAALVMKQSHWPLDRRHRLLEWSLWTFNRQRWSTNKVNGHQIDNLVTKWGRGTLCVFGKCFTKFSKVKYFTTFYKGFYDQSKIFYKFDYILLANKHLKMEKYFTLKQTKCSIILN